MTEDKNKADPAAFKAEEIKANDPQYKQTDETRDKSGERNPEAAAERVNRNEPQPKPDVTLSRTNETEEEAKERGAKAKAKGGTNNEPGMDKPVPASTPQKNDLVGDLKARTDGNYDRLVEDDKQPSMNEDGTPKAMRAKSDDEVSVRVLKAGDGQIGNGAEGRYKKGDTFEIDRKIAEDLEARHFVEIED